MDADAEYAKKCRNCAIQGKNESYLKRNNVAMRYWTINIKRTKRMKKNEKNR